MRVQTAALAAMSYKDLTLPERFKTQELAGWEAQATQEHLLALNRFGEALENAVAA
jgi:hypothetical protein